MPTEHLSVPRATYRLQFHAGFTFADACRVIPYLDALGISHIYASPFLRARTGSTHGYDIIDHNALNPEIGDETAFDTYCATLADHTMGQIVDFVPNHMGIGSAGNPWWQDVLEWGEESPYAGYFDIDWDPAKVELRGKVLLPFLGDHYGKVLIDGALKLTFDAVNGSLGVWYYEHYFPLHPGTYAIILRPALEHLQRESELDQETLAELTHLVAGFADLRRKNRSQRRSSVRRSLAERLKRQLSALAQQRGEVGARIEAVVGTINGTPQHVETFRALHELLEKQPYRLAHWLVAAEEINYRRFFQINDLAGIRIELPEVFAAVHGQVLQWIARGCVHGLRIDHIDGLFEPQRYLERLQARIREVRGATEGDDDDAYIVVEKILASHESLPEGWPVAGTTGYEFLNRVNDLLIDSDAERAMTRIYERFCGKGLDFPEIAYLGRKLAMEQELASELRVLANEINKLTETNWMTRDYTLVGLRQALREIVACFPVYRTYVNQRSVRPEDRRDIEWAIAHGRRHSQRVDSSVFDFLSDLLTTDLARKRPLPLNRREVRRLAMKFQQYTGAVMAKGLEDTAFYRYCRLVSLNEVGGDPERFGMTPAAFHRTNQDAARRWPHTLLATATHDTKRGEDARARVTVLSEVPGEWTHAVTRWFVQNRRHKSVVNDRPAPAAADEYLLYQTLIGTWPTEFCNADPLPADGVAAYTDRICDYMLKAVREAKVHSSWVNPDPAYEEALAAFVAKTLDVQRPNPFLRTFRPFATRIARAGVVNSLVQTTLKLTVPGVPDIYQGCELWDLSLVDPDNRRPVDFAHRMAMLESLAQRFGNDAGDSAAAALLEEWPSGSVKMFTTWRLLQLRRALSTVFLRGAYTPVDVEGPGANSLFGFVRTEGEDAVLVVVPRLSTKVMQDSDSWPVGDAAWHDTHVIMPLPPSQRHWRNVFTGESLPEAEPTADGTGFRFAAARMLSAFPIGVWS